MKRNANQALSTFLSMRKDLDQDNGHSSDLDQKRSGIPTHEYKPQGEWDRVADDNICRKQTPSLPIHESIIQRSAQEQRWWKIVNPLLCRFGNDWDDFPHNHYCKSAQSLRSSRRNVWHQRISQEGLYSCRCSTTSLVDQETMKKNASPMPFSFLFLQKRFGTGQWSFIGPGSEKKW